MDRAAIQQRLEQHPEIIQFKTNTYLIRFKNGNKADFRDFNLVSCTFEDVFKHPAWAINYNRYLNEEDTRFLDDARVEDWLCETVLPSIRKYGGYSCDPEEQRLIVLSVRKPDSMFMN